MIRDRNGQLALSELTHRVGLMAGSTFMDDMFVKFAKELLGHEGFDFWTGQNPKDFSKLKCKAWEEAKLAFNGTSDAFIDLPFSLIRSLPDEVCRPLCSVCNSLDMLAHSVPVYSKLASM